MYTKQDYQQMIVEMADQCAGIIEDGASVKISRSRSGLKLFRCFERHEVVKKHILMCEDGRFGHENKR